MQLIRSLLDLQHQNGWVSNEQLNALSQSANVPLYRLEELVSFYPHFRRTPPASNCIAVCRDLTCRMRGSRELAKTLESESAAGGGATEVVMTSCLGQCDAAPAVLLNDYPLGEVRAAELSAAVSSAGEEPCRPDALKVLFPADRVPNAESGVVGSSWRIASEEPFSGVRRLAADLSELRKMAPEILGEANLKGMGGAGFPTGRKWAAVRDEPGERKYVICNADESEPGTFKDRVILQTAADRVIEGMILAGLTVGASHGIVFLRHEYVEQRTVLQAAIDHARADGVLGEDACGTGSAFDIEIFVSPGGYILGEETALLECLEDKRGEPRNKPPYPVSNGLWGCPTVINNVETLALAAAILDRGLDWWNAFGQHGGQGLKFVCLSGDVKNPCVAEVESGILVRDLLELAGGMSADGPPAAVLPGGASSRFLSPDCLDLPYHSQSIRDAGSSMGTGAVVFLDSSNNLQEVAQGLVEFFRNESCGKCVPCRLGSEQAVRLLEEQTDSETIPPSTEDVIRDLNATLEQTSICGLGQVALMPIVSLLDLRNAADNAAL